MDGTSMSFLKFFKTRKTGSEIQKCYTYIRASAYGRFLIRQVTMASARPIQDPTVSSTTVDEEDSEELLEDLPPFVLVCEECGRGFIYHIPHTHCAVCRPGNNEVMLPGAP